MTTPSFKKVAYIGAHSSAKTTTVNRLSWFLNNDNKNVYVIREVPRDIPTDLSINQEGGFQSQRWMLEEQIRRELTAERDALQYALDTGETSYIICDRSIWDYLAYSRSLNKHEKLTDKEYDEIKTLVLLALQVITDYDEIYFCEMKPLYDDGVRDTNAAWRSDVYDCFKKIIKDYNLNVTVVQ